MTTLDTGERRRGADVRPVITELIDEATVESIAQDAWIALVGEEEVLVPLPGEPVTDRHAGLERTAETNCSPSITGMFQSMQHRSGTQSSPLPSCRTSRA